ncbi:MAG: hypothetical protein AAGF12_37815 [Myxococcota bacterium]
MSVGEWSTTPVEIAPGKELFFHVDGDARGVVDSVSKYGGRYSLRIELLRDGVELAALHCDPLYHAGSGQGRRDGPNASYSGDVQDCFVRPAPEGPAELRALLTSREDADLVLLPIQLTVMSAPARADDYGSNHFWEGGPATATEKWSGFGLLTLFFAIVMAVWTWRSKRRTAARRHLWQTGLPGEATVKKLSGTGKGVNDDPEVFLTLDVRADGCPPFQATCKGYVEQLAIPRVQPGCVVAVRIDPKTNEVLVDPELFTQSK